MNDVLHRAAKLQSKLLKLDQKESIALEKVREKFETARRELTDADPEAANLVEAVES